MLATVLAVTELTVTGVSPLLKTVNDCPALATPSTAPEIDRTCRQRKGTGARGAEYACPGKRYLIVVMR